MYPCEFGDHSKPMPDDIGPKPWINLRLGVYLLILASPFGVPIFFALYYDGIESVLDWNSLFNWLSAITAIFVGTALYLILTPQRVGGNICFEEGGFWCRMRLFFRRDAEQTFSWRDIKEIELLQGPRNNDVLNIKSANGAEMSLQVKFFELGISEIFARFRISADAACYRLEQTKSVDALIMSKQTWTVLPKS